MKRILIAGLLLMALFAAALHWRIHNPFTADGIRVGFLIANVLMWIDVVVVTALFLNRRTAALAFLLNGILVIYGSVMMFHYSAAQHPAGLSGWLIGSLVPDIVAAWADFCLGAALWVVYVREGQALGARGVARKAVPNIRGEHLVVVGGGVAGVSAVEAARSENPAIAITLIGDEPELPYRRLRLTPYLAGQESRESLLLRPRQWYRDRRINLLTDTRVTRIDPTARTLTLRGDQPAVRYDQLVLATGSFPRRLPMAGLDKPNVFYVRRLADAEALRSAARSHDECVVIGGGLLGLETAKALALAGANVQVIEAADRVLPRQLDERGSERLADALRREGLALHLGRSVKQVHGEDRVSLVRLDNGVSLFANVVVVAVGIQPVTDLARGATCEVDRGIVVDDALSTTVDGIFAAGDAARHGGVVYGIWPAAMEQGRIAGINAAGGDEVFEGIVPFNPLKVVDAPVYSIGVTGAEVPTDRELVLDTAECYKKLTVRGDRLIGAVLVGDTAESEALAGAVVEGLDVSHESAGGDAAAVLAAIVDHARSAV